MITRNIPTYSIVVSEQFIQKDRPDLNLTKRFIHIDYTDNVKWLTKFLNTTNPSLIKQIGIFDSTNAKQIVTKLVDKYKHSASNLEGQWFFLSDDEINELLNYLNQLK